MTRSCEDCGLPTGGSRWARCAPCHATRRRRLDAERAFVHGWAAALAWVGLDPDDPAARDALRARLAELAEEAGARAEPCAVPSSPRGGS